MAALALRPLRQLSPVLRRPVSRSCGGPQERPSPPCAPAERPACRPRPAAAAPRGVRVVCCAPPQGARPPCAPRAAAPPLTCADRTGTRVLKCSGPCRDGSGASARCGDGQDRVARRLGAARAARRADYEREAGSRTAAPRAAAAPYSLGEDRVCSRATDGREYELPRAPLPAPRCGPGRAPPPPRCVPLRPDDACRVSDGRLDPCANRPRVFVEIDRTAAPPSPSAPAPPRTPDVVDRCDRPPTATAKSLTSRIMDGLGRGRRSTGGGALGGDSRRDRRLHTSVATKASSCPEPGGAAGGLAAALRARGALAAAGRGRAAARCEGAGAAPLAPPAGRLELPVPSGADRVTVCVALARAPAAATPPPPRPVGGRGGSPSAGRDSWLSIKTIQQKFSACRRSDDAARGREGACPPKRPAPRAGGGGAVPVKPRPKPDSKENSPCVDKKPPRDSDVKKYSPTLTPLTHCVLTTTNV